MKDVTINDSPAETLAEFKAWCAKEKYSETLDNLLAWLALERKSKKQALLDNMIAEADDKASKYPHLPCGCGSLGKYFENLGIELRKVQVE